MDERLSRRAARRVLRAAVRRFGRSGLDGASLDQVARDAEVSPDQVRAAYATKEQLLVEAQAVTFAELHRRFVERADSGQRGLPAALDALDGMWNSVRTLQDGAPFVVETLSLACREGPLQARMGRFYVESTALLEDGIRRVFADELDSLAVPPGRMAVLIRILLEGLAVELAQAHTPGQLARVDQAYADMRALFERFVLTGDSVAELDTGSIDSIPLPW